jgi:ribonuclease BN (tRNA processing enzyme)
MGDLHLAFVGSGNAFAEGGLCWNGFVANGRYLFEAPPTALMALNKMGIEPNDLDAVILSHHHGDHFLGLPSLILHWKYRKRTRPMVILGPPGTEDLTRAIGNSVYPGLFEFTFPLTFVTAVPGTPIHICDLEVEPVEVKHDDRLIMSLGYACRLDSRTFAYTGDTALCEGALDLARRAEVLVAECASRNEDIPVHMNLVKDIPILRSAMKPESTLLLTHLGADIDTATIPMTEAARDFAHYRF